MDENDFDENEWTIMAVEADFYDSEVDEWITTAAENNPYGDRMWSSLVTTPDFDDFSATHVEENYSNDFKLDSNNIARVEQLRLEFSQLMNRKNVVMEMLIDLFENNVVRLTSVQTGRVIIF